MAQRKLSMAESRRQLVNLLRDDRKGLLGRWSQRVRDEAAVPSATKLSRPDLQDELPQLLDAIAQDLACAPGDFAECHAGTMRMARSHARQRASRGYGVSDELRELSILRGVAFELCAERGILLHDDAARAFDAAIDARMIAGADEMERVARDRRQQLLKLLDASHEAVFAWDLGGNVVFWNRGAEELYGWTHAEAIGTDPHELLHTEHPLGMARLEGIVAEEGRWEGQLTHTARDGKKLLVESRWVGERDATGKAVVLEANRDITEREQAQRARRAGEARLRAVVDTALDAIITIDERGTIETFNPSAERIFGYRAAEVVGRNIKALVPDPHGCAHDGHLARCQETGEAGILGVGREVTAVHRNGSVFPIDLALSETTVGERRTFTGIIRDITDRKRVDAERESLLASERAARAEAERAAYLRDEFVAMVSHELRTPLNAILGWATMLQGGKLDAAATAKALEVVVRNAKAQAELVEDLLDISRIGSGKLRLDVRPVNLGAIMENVIASQVPAAQAKGVRLELHHDCSEPTVQGDPGRLEQIVSNLLSNAIKFTPTGGRVDASCRRVQSRVEVVVRDTGRGIAPDFLPHVFDRFRQADASLTRQHRGLGLGLALVKFLVEQHGGTIRVESDGEGRGATFVLAFPLSAVKQPEGAALSPLDACASLAGVKTLVVDDEEDARTLLRRILEDCQAQVTVAGSAREALAELPRLHPDVMVCDIGMPEIDGYHLITAVRALSPEQGGRTPAVALTAFARPEDRLRALRAGYQMHLAKPVDPAELLVALANLAGRLDGPGLR